jgi:hypothetical protein
MATSLPMKLKILKNNKISIGRSISIYWHVNISMEFVSVSLGYNLTISHSPFHLIFSKFKNTKIYRALTIVSDCHLSSSLLTIISCHCLSPLSFTIISCRCLFLSLIKQVSNILTFFLIFYYLYYLTMNLIVLLCVIIISFVSLFIVVVLLVIGFFFIVGFKL